MCTYCCNSWPWAQTQLWEPGLVAGAEAGCDTHVLTTLCSRNRASTVAVAGLAPGGWQLRQLDSPKAKTVGPSWVKLQRSIVAAMAVGLLIDKSYWDSLHSRMLGSTTVNTAGSLVVKTAGCPCHKGYWGSQWQRLLGSSVEQATGDHGCTYCMANTDNLHPSSVSISLQTPQLCQFPQQSGWGKINADPKAVLQKAKEADHSSCPPFPLWGNLWWWAVSAWGNMMMQAKCSSYYFCTVILMGFFCCCCSFFSTFCCSYLTGLLSFCRAIFIQG